MTLSCLKLFIRLKLSFWYFQYIIQPYSDATGDYFTFFMIKTALIENNNPQLHKIN